LLLDATHLETLGKYDEAELIWRSAADQGSAEGNFRVGLAAQGRHEFTEAQKRYEIAAGLGNDNAMFALGRLNEELDNTAEAKRWYRLASEHNHPAATVSCSSTPRLC
jgi:hypothetical protein